MKKEKVFFIVLSCVLLLFVVGVIKLSWDVDVLKNEIKDKESKIINLNDEVSSKENLLVSEQQKNIELVSSVESYKKMNEGLLGKVSELDNIIEGLNLRLGNIDLTLEEIEQHEEDIRESMSWFQENTNILELDDFNAVRSGLGKFCIRYEDEYCEVKTVCLRLINEVFHFIKYRQDIKLTGEIDFLQNLSSILDNHGGDCEDFSLLAMAELNYLEGLCDGKLRFESFEYASGYESFADYTDKYILSGSKVKKLDSSLYKPYVVCGNFPGQYDPNKRFFDVFGHCVIGIGDREIDSSSDVVDFLRNSVMFEPQDGSFIVDLRESNFFEIPVDSVPDNPFFLRIVITDKDLYRFDLEEERWIGYEDYMNSIEVAKEKIIALKD